MKHLFTIILMLSAFCLTAYAQDGYYARKTSRYQREAGYSARQAVSYSRAVSCQNDVDCYTRNKNHDNARTYPGYVTDMMDKFNTCMKWAANADGKAGTYLRWAAEALEKQ